MPITATSNKSTSVFRNVEWSAADDSSAPILRKAAAAAVLHDARLEISFDEERGDYTLAMPGERVTAPVT